MNEMTHVQRLAWQAGFDAAEAGEAETDNPFIDPTDPLHLCWNDGFAAGLDLG